MQFITTDQRIAVENFDLGLIYTVTFTSGSYFLGACIGIGKDYIMFQRTAPELIFSLTMATAADVASIEPLGDDIGKILEYTGTVPTTIKTDGSPLLKYIISGNILPGTGDRTANLFDKSSTVIYNAYFNNAGYWLLSGDSKSIKFPCLPNTQYTISVPNILSIFRLYESSNANIEPSSASSERVIEITRSANINKYTFTTSSTSQILLFQGSNGDVDLLFNGLMLNTGSTALPYEPYSYKIPIISGSTTTNIYLDNPLRKSLDGTAVDELSSSGRLTQRVDTDGSVLSTPIISYIDTPTIPTTDGFNVFDVDTTVKPSEVYLKYFSPLL